MSLVPTNISRLKPEIRLAQAISQFEADLSSEQKTSFRSFRSQSCDSPPDPSDVMRLTAEIDRRASAKVGGGRCFGPRLTNFLQAVQQYAALGDIIVGGSQNLIACGVWSLVRMSMLLIVNFSSYLERLSSLLMTIGRSAPRYQIMALLYPQSKDLQSHLSEYFIVVVRLCHQLLKFTQKSMFGQFTSTLSDSDIKNYQSDINLWANTIKEEVNLLIAKRVEEEAEENSRFRALSSIFSKSVLLQQKIKTNLRVLNICSTYDYETMWKQTRKIGNATLLNQNAEYLDWKGQADSCTLIYTGKLGSGKSVLLANIVDDLNLYVHSKNVIVAFFFCQHDIPESLRARTIIGSLIRQLLLPVPDLAIVAGLLDETTPALDFERIESLLQQGLSPNCKAYFILDGMDECDPTEREMLIQLLQKLQETFTLLLCVSLRLEPKNVLNLDSQHFTAARVTSIPEDNPDIEAFITTELEKRIESKKLVIGNPTLILEIRDTLLEGSQGMFLWVALQIESLCSMKTDDAIHQALVDLPKNLPETFSRILQRSEGSGKPYQRLVLGLVTVAHRPLTTEEVREALSVVPGDAVWNPAKLLNDIYSTLGCCGSLITVDEEELTIRLVHHSVKQFLLSGFNDATNPPFTIESAKTKMADIIVTYLNYGIFETQLSTIVVPQIMAGSAPSKIIRSTLNSSSNVRSLALKLLKSRKQPNCDIGRILAEASTLFSSQSVGKFHFYAYAKSYWLQHIFYISEQEPVMHDLLLRLFKGKAVDANATDETGQTPLSRAAGMGYRAVVKLLLDSCRVDANSKDSKGRTPLWEAADNGHEAVVTLLLDRGADVKAKSLSDWTPLWWAAKNGHEAVVTLLLDKGANIEASDESNRTPLWLAAQNGHKAVVTLLLNKGASVESNNKSDQTPLWEAAQNGHKEVVMLLLDRGANFEVKNEPGRTLLSWAAENGHEAVVALLLDRGANIEVKDQSSQTPLLWAAQNGHEAVVMPLLDRGADIEAKNKSGWTPLLWAAQSGHKAVVTLLLDKGANIEASDECSRTPLWLAAQNGHKEVVTLLLNKGANIEANSESDQTPLWEAARNGHKAAATLLLDRGADIEAKNESGWTPLWWAAQNGHEAVVMLLLDKGANVEANVTSGRTLLWWAARNGHKAVVALLLDRGANIEVKDQSSQTPLLWAARNGHEAVVMLLLDKGADIEANDKSGRTPLWWAAGNGHEAVVRLLLDRGANIEAKSQSDRTPLLWAAENGREAVVKLLQFAKYSPSSYIYNKYDT